MKTKAEQLQELINNRDPSIRLQKVVTNLAMSKAINKLDTIKGDKGDTGDMGPRGDKGDKGDNIVGPKGDKGDKGDSPSITDLRKLIIPLIPEPINGKDGRDGKDAISPEINKIVSLVKKEIKQEPINFKDIKGTEKLIEFLKLGGFRGGGSSGGGGSSTQFSDAEIPSGTINGSNLVFNLLNIPTAGSPHIYLNGLRQTKVVDYSISGATITMTSAPLPGDTLLVDYRY